MSLSTNLFFINSASLEEVHHFSQTVGIDPNELVDRRPWVSVNAFFSFFGLEATTLEPYGEVRLGWEEVVTLSTLLSDYLAICQQRGGNETGDCPSFSWAHAYEALPMGEALPLLKPTEVALESALWAFECMLPFLSVPVREHFCDIISTKGTHALQSLNWKRLVRAYEHDHCPYPSKKEDILLRGQWHSSFVGISKLPNQEDA